MDKLYSWNVKRAGAAMTINHSCGKITNVDLIQAENGVIVATCKDGRKFELHQPVI